MDSKSTQDSSFGTSASGDNPLVNLFDGSGRLPRKTQVDALNWIHSTFPTSDSPLVIEAGVGCGKTAQIGRAHV